MQSDRDKPDWQQPTSQPSQTPFVAAAQETSTRTPVVTLAPDEPQPATTWQPNDDATQEDQMTMQPSDQHEMLPEDTVPVAQPATQEPVRWRASEYIHREKNAVWFILFGAVVVALMAASIFLMDSITFTILIPVMAAALIVYTHRPPRMIDYTLSSQGLHINDHLYPFSDFKGFGVIHDEEEYSVMLLPTKRFKPGVSVYFPEESGEAIVDMLGVRLPMQELHLDAFDKIIHKLRI